MSVSELALRLKKDLDKKKAAELRLNKQIVEEKVDEATGVVIKVCAPQRSGRKNKARAFKSQKQKDQERMARMQQKNDKPKDAYELAVNYGVQQEEADDFDVRMNMMHSKRLPTRRKRAS